MSLRSNNDHCVDKEHDHFAYLIKKLILSKKLIVDMTYAVNFSLKTFT